MPRQRVIIPEEQRFRCDPLRQTALSIDAACKVLAKSLGRDKSISVDRFDTMAKTGAYGICLPIACVCGSRVTTVEAIDWFIAACTAASTGTHESLRSLSAKRAEELAAESRRDVEALEELGVPVGAFTDDDEGGAA